MRKISILLIMLLPVIFVGAQTAYVLPSPTDAEAEITLYIDINQSSDGVQNNALKAMLQDHPDDNVYLWSWMPAEPVVGNGQWGESNEELLMTKESDLLYSITFTPTEFYGVEGADFFNSGISCLAKLQNGNAYEDDGYDGEAKTEDLMVEIIPKLCDDVLCVFPEIRRSDDYVSITYDNNQETSVPLQNMGSNDCYIFVGYIMEGASIQPLHPVNESEFYPELQLKPIDEPGFFRITFIPEELLKNVRLPGDVLERLRIFIVRAGGIGTGGPPTQIDIPFINCD